MSSKDSLKDIRDAVFASTDWDPSATPAAVAAVDGFINRAAQQVALDAPFMFFEEKVRFKLEPDVVAVNVFDVILFFENDDVTGTPDNPWVFYVVQPAGGGGVTDWEVDRSWDGRMVDILELDDETFLPTGRILHTTRIRSVWREAASDKFGDLAAHWVVSLWNPFPITEYGTGPFNWRVYTSEYYLPDDLIELRSMRVVGRQAPGQIEVMSQDEAERAGIDDDQYIVGGGIPRMAYRRSHFQLPGPNVPPAVALADPDQGNDHQWRGPEPFGEFQYCITYTWGKRSFSYKSPGLDFWNTDGGRWLEDGGGSAQTREKWGLDRSREPLWESSPSPPTASITVAALTGEGEIPAPTGAIRVLLPNIEYMQGFMLTGTSTGAVPFERISDPHSGWHVRIYRRRLDEDFTNYHDLGDAVPGQSIDSLRKLDIHDAFFLLAEMRIDAFNEGQFFDTGEYIPDYNRRLRNVHGYQGIRFHPMPDAEYEIETRMIRRPQRLVSESDAPPLHPEAIKLLIDFSLALTYERLKEPMNAQKALMDYQNGLMTLRKRYGDLRPQSQPVRLRPARVRSYNGFVPMWRRRNT